MNFGMMKYPLMNILEGGAGGGGTPPPNPDPGGGAGGGGTPPPAFVPPEWAKNLSVGEDILKEPMFQSVKTIDDVVKGYYHAQKMVGADKVVVPTKSSTPEEWKAFYQKGGLPPTIEEYKPELPASLVDQEFKNTLLKKAYELNVKPDQLAAIVNELDSHNTAMAAQADKVQKQGVVDTAEKLKKEWGSDFQRNLVQAQRVIKHFAGDEMLQEVLGSPLASDEKFLKLLVNISGKMTQEDTFQQEVVTRFGTSREDAQKKLNALIGDFNGPYYDSSHAQHKEKVDEMLMYQKILAETNQKA